MKATHSKNPLSKILDSEFYRHVIVLFSGSALAQAIPFLMLPILQKWFYSPAQFGVFSLFVSVTSILNSFVSLKYEFAIVGSKHKTEALNNTIATLGIATGFSILLLATAALTTTDLLQSYNLSALYKFRYWIVLSVFGFTAHRILTYYFNFEKKYGIISLSKVLQTGSAEGGKAAMGFFQQLSGGLIYGRTLGQWISFLQLSVLFIRRNRLILLNTLSIQGMKKRIIKEKDFALFSTPGALLGALSNNFHIILLASYFNDEIVGLVGTAFIYVAVPMSLISTSVSQVFFKKIHEIKSRKELFRVYKSGVTKLTGAGLIIAFFIQFIPESLVELILDSTWVSSLLYLKIIIWYLSISFVSTSLSFIYIRLKKQKQMLFFDVIHLLLVYFGIVMGFKITGSPEGTLWFFTAAQAFYYLLAIFAAFYFIKKSKLLS